MKRDTHRFSRELDEFGKGAKYKVKLGSYGMRFGHIFLLVGITFLYLARGFYRSHTPLFLIFLLLGGGAVILSWLIWEKRYFFEWAVAR